MLIDGEAFIRRGVVMVYQLNGKWDNRAKAMNKNRTKGI
jgi:hypothetical protein